MKVIISILLLAISSYFLGRKLSNKKGGIISACLAVLLLPLNMIVIISNAFLIFLCNIFLLLSLKVCYKNNAKGSTFILLGVIGGISFLLYMGSISIIISAIILVLLKDNKFLISGNGLLFLLSFLLGSLPFWLFNINNCFYSFKLVEQRMYIWYVPLLWLLYGAVFGCFCYRIRDSVVNIARGTLKNTSKYSLIFLAGIITIIINASLDFMPVKEIPFHVFLYLTLPFIITFFLLDIKSGAIKNNAFLSIMVILLLGNILYVQKEWRVYKDVRNMILKLRSQDVKLVYTYCELVPLINIFGDGVVTALAVDKEYKPSVFRFGKAAIVIPHKQGVEPVNQLRFSGVSYKKMNSGPFILLYDLKPFFTEGRKISAEKWSAISNCNSGETKLAFDHNMGTRWTTNSGQRPGMFFQLDLGEKKIIDRIVLVLGSDIYDGPSGIKIKVSTDRKKWKEVVRIHNNKEILFWDRSYVSMRKNIFNKQEFVFTPIKARYIKIIQTGYKFNEYWTIRELEIYSR